jgi:hypothetical protein
MTRKIQSSLQFRKNTPGQSLGSVKRMARYGGQLYTFQYTSYGPNRAKPRPNIDKRPLLLLAYKGGTKVWKAKNGKSYIYGFNLNYLEAHRRLEVIRNLVDAFAEKPGRTLSYEELKGELNLPAAKEDSIFRKYDVRGGKLRQLKQVDLDTYESYLQKSLNENDD